MGQFLELDFYIQKINIFIQIKITSYIKLIDLYYLKKNKINCHMIFIFFNIIILKFKNSN